MKRYSYGIGNRGLCGNPRPTQAEKDELQERIRLAREEPEKIFPPELIEQRRVCCGRRDIPTEPGVRVINTGELKAAKQDLTSESP